MKPTKIVNPFTPYPEVNSILQVLLSGIREILKDRFSGMYLYGSLAYGGFDRDSDIDFLVVTHEELTEREFVDLQAMHTRTAGLASVWATQLEGSYIPLHALQSYDPARALYFHIDRGADERLRRMQIDEPRLSRAWWGGWALLRAVLRNAGITLAGPAPETFMAPIAPQEVKQAARAILLGWAVPLLDDPGQISTRRYQSYTVLTLCRMLYTFDTGAIVPKLIAARHAQEILGDPWHALIERAWDGRHHPLEKAAAGDVQATLKLIRLVMARS